MGDLEKLFDQGTGGRSHKWRHYFAIYERYLEQFRNKPCTYLEVGVEHGGTLDIMKTYLGSQARLIGVDISPSCKELESKGYEIFIGDQSNKEFMEDVGRRSGGFDIIIDDGGHTPDQQITTFFALFPYLKNGGIYLVEDLHTNLWASHQATRYGFTFLDFAKSLADKMTYWHLDPHSFMVFWKITGAKAHTDIQNYAMKQIYGIHFYDSVVVFEKREIAPPQQERR